MMIIKSVEANTLSGNQHYDHGERGVKANAEKAVEFYTLAANQGHQDAQFELARCYENGSGVVKNLEKAVEFYTLAANQGYRCAQYNLAQCYINGKGVAKNEAKAAELFTLAANQEHRNAQYEVAQCYENGRGVAKNEEKAAEFYILAATKRAQYKLAMLYLIDRISPQNVDDVFLLLSDEIFDSAQYDLACYYQNTNNEDVKKSLTWFMRCGNMTPIANLIDKQQYEIETLKARVVELEITVPIEGGPLYQEAMKRFNELKEFYV